MELLKKPIHLNQSKKPITDQFFLTEDYNVPDAKRDIARIIFSQGKVQVEEIKHVENYLRVIGKLYFQVLYVTEEGEARLTSLDGKLPFEELIYMEEKTEEHCYIKDARVEYTATMIHSRKLSMKAMIELEISGEGLYDEAATIDVDCQIPIHKKTKPIKLLQIHTCKKDCYRIKEELNIPGTKETVGTLLWTDISKRKLDTKLGADELLLKGELIAFCFYESTDGKMDWIEQSIPYEGRISCSGADESMYHQVYASLEEVHVDIRMDEDGEMRILGIEGTLTMQIAIYEEEHMEMLEDVYSLEKECVVQREDTCYEELVLQNHSKCKVVEQLSLPELKEDILQICHSNGALQVDDMQIVDGKIQIDGVLHICFLYVKANDAIPFDTWQGMIPFSYVIESNDKYEKLCYDIAHTIEQLTVTMLGSNEVEVKAVLAFDSFLRTPIQMKSIVDIQIKEYDREIIGKRPGIVGYVVKSGDELWNLAKKYCTTVEAIKNINEIGGSEIKEGDKILIFKENMSIL
ncbi:MAG: DUF3794 domain-containing protein [Lachnospiraceae bacterium]